ncbi:MAG: cell division protein FtsL [Rhodobacteraceae bacterium]|nr:cell division protein FtsL [Paracoccaceae bacterium]
MRLYQFLLSLLLIVALAWWAYSEVNATKSAIAEVRQLKADIAHQQELLELLEAEWAYLTRPDRIESLVKRYFSVVQLVPLTALGFGDIRSVPLRNGDEGLFDEESSLLLAMPELWIPR